MSTKTSTTRNTTTTAIYETATSIAELMTSAKTPHEKGYATRKKREYIAKRVEEGRDATRVEASINTLCERLRRGK